MNHQDNHVIRITPDDESIEFEMNQELEHAEQRMIAQRVRYALEQKRRHLDEGSPSA